MKANLRAGYAGTKTIFPGILIGDVVSVKAKLRAGYAGAKTIFPSSIDAASALFECN